MKLEITFVMSPRINDDLLIFSFMTNLNNIMICVRLIGLGNIESLSKKQAKQD